MEPYNTEEEQVEALRRWWDENGRSTIAAIVIALAAGFGWQAWQKHDQGQSNGQARSHGSPARASRYRRFASQALVFRCRQRCRTSDALATTKSLNKRRWRHRRRWDCSRW